MRVIVTGGTGFIGRNLVKELNSQGYDVTCLVRETSNTDLLENLDVDFVVCDIMDEQEIKNVFNRIRPDIVIHCAASVMEKDREKLMDVNVTTTKNIAQASYEHDVGRFVYLSSVSVISGNPKVPLEEDLPYSASNGYGFSKIEAERMVKEYRKKGLKTAILRPCMVYGNDEPHLLDKLFRYAEKRFIPVLNDPVMNSKLQLVHVSNVVEAIIMAMNKEEALTDTFMVADKEIITMKRFVEIVTEEMIGKSPFVIPGWIVKIGKIIPFLRRKMERTFKDRVYDILRAVDVLGYDPKISTEEGLKMTVRHWKSKRKDHRL
ncbi:MAG: NAD(P)-dependent oxidoreductase [Candidatus Aadella gelida]|nr:NAD(P)-dependent oxidoreductase [Candidatus Aadella gelida]